MFKLESVLWRPEGHLGKYIMSGKLMGVMLDIRKGLVPSEVMDTGKAFNGRKARLLPVKTELS